MATTRTMTAAPTPRWFRFGLRTMFVVVALFLGWLSWNLPKAVEREKFLKAM